MACKKTIPEEKIDLQLLNALNNTSLFSLKSSLEDSLLYTTNNPKHRLHNYQVDAARHPDAVLNMKDTNQCNQLMFYMTTGSRKIDIMVAVILYMFRAWGYQCFLFTTNTTAVVDKAIDNLVNSVSAKYLYNNPLVIDGDYVTIKKVDRYSVNLGKDTIYIKLAGIQQLSNDYYTPRGNGITKDSLVRRKLALLADEVHHFNVSTRSKKASQEGLSWGYLLDEIRQLNHESKQLEFTATIDLHNPDIYHKYQSKTIAQYDLSHFINDGFSKKVYRLQASNSDENKMFNAALLSQYRKHIAQNISILDFKPVILFKPNTIAESRAINETFLTMVDSLSVEPLQQFIQNQNRSTQSGAFSPAYKYWLNQDFGSTITELKRDFNKFATINTNDSGSKNILDDESVSRRPNSLESPDNPIRSVFAVAKLSEGWDVLNLFDIVQIGEENIKPKDTNAEAQLIRRGARCYPFVYHGKKSYTRRFDDHKPEIQLLGRLYYHTINDPQYLENLRKSLDAIDLSINENTQYKVYTAKIKNSFKKTKAYKHGNIYYNKVIDVPESHCDSIQKYGFDPETTGPIDMVNAVSERRYDTGADKNSTTSTTLRVAARSSNPQDEALIHTAVPFNNFYRFDSPKKYCPTLTGMREFLISNGWLGNATIRVKVATGSPTLTNEQRLTAIKEYLVRVQTVISNNFKRSIGTSELMPIAVNEVIQDYQKRVGDQFGKSALTGPDSIQGKDWYVYDYTIADTLEKHFIDRINSIMPELTHQYGQAYLLRIDEHTTDFELRDFGENIFHYEGYMPDFILYLENENSIYQIFLEPRGTPYIERDKWKEKLLERINPDNIKVLGEDEKVKIYDLKFYVEDDGKEDTHGLSQEMRDKNILQ